MPAKTILVLVVFALTYLLIAARQLRFIPIGRPAGALLGAVAMVVIGAITPEETFQAVDHNTIVLLFAMMLLTVYLDRAGFFEAAASLLLRMGRSPANILAATGVCAAVLSAFLVNDAVCLFLTPLIIVTCRRGGLPLGPFLIAIATSSNIGSAATLVGNPQNMIIGSLSQYSFATFLLRSLPAVVAGLAANLLLLFLYYRKHLPRSLDPAALYPMSLDRRRLLLVGLVSLGIMAGFFGGFHLGYTALAGVLVLILIDQREPREAFARVDWTLLVFFCGLFVVVAALRKTGLVEYVWQSSRDMLNLDTHYGLAMFSGWMTVGSNVVSNVPMVLLAGPHLAELGNPSLGWVLLAFTTTIAGNLTLVGSVANIIVAERAKDHYTLGFYEYLRFGLVSTLVVLAVGVPLVCLGVRWF
jgi:Na+/H+ antiporter NhaD/arsenite permease-like protein